ncbi:fam-a protein [Plasmodium vinckei vinckei]|uniref:Fam-a protein n=1 Tax=Plasmodium vinckei vinckei TaxID=54757 RepID=A0A449BXL8_PLAVN|nr:fam-a protein [Plasmodium vinckei vinckei]VEV58079.1 fam-a protein [Plasmodium vinckei vinckei]
MNKFYIQIVLFFLSVSVYLNNKALATEPAPEENTETKPPKRYLTPEEIFAKNKHLLCTNRNEIINAANLMSEAAAHLENHATSKNGYDICKWTRNFNITLSTKKDEGNIIIQKTHFKYYNVDKYKKIINMLWDPNSEHFLDKTSSKRKIARVYNPNLVMIQQRYKSWSEGRDKYFYALAANIEISPYETIIVISSPNVNDGYPSDKEYKNKIVENANLFKLDINSEDDIKNGEIKKTNVNIAGYFIRKICNFIDIIYIESIDGHNIRSRKENIKKTLNNIYSL